MNKKEQPGRTKRKMLIIDDHPLLREGIAKIINQQEDLIVCGEAGNAPDGLAAVPKFRPDLATVDLSLGEGNGLELIKNLHAQYPKLPTLVVTMHREDIYAERALRAGAHGYVMKRELAETLIQAIRKVLSGQIAVSENIVTQLMNCNRAALLGKRRDNV